MDLNDTIAKKAFHHFKNYSDKMVESKKSIKSPEAVIVSCTCA